MSVVPLRLKITICSILYFLFRRTPYLSTVRGTRIHPRYYASLVQSWSLIDGWCDWSPRSTTVQMMWRVLDNSLMEETCLYVELFSFAVDNVYIYIYTMYYIHDRYVIIWLIFRYTYTFPEDDRRMVWCDLLQFIASFVLILNMVWVTSWMLIQITMMVSLQDRISHTEYFWTRSLEICRFVNLRRMRDSLWECMRDTCSKVTSPCCHFEVFPNQMKAQKGPAGNL